MTSDPRVQSAIANWAPRFIAQGVDYNDFFRTTARINSWNDWCREWCATGDVHRDLARVAEAKGNLISAGEACIAAALCYHFGKFLFQDHHHEYLNAGRKAIDAHARGLQLLDPTAERIEIPFAGARLIGVLRRPNSHPASLAAQGTNTQAPPQLRTFATRDVWGGGQPPLIVLLPGLDSTKEEFFHWENVFLARGMATFTLEGPGQGECGYQLPIRPDYEVAVSAALDALTQRNDLDTNRVGVAGVSLGGYYAARACLDPRVKAAVENCGPFTFAADWSSMPALTRASFQYHSGAGDDVEAQQLAQAITLDSVAHKITQPLLIIHGKQDRVVPWQHAQKIADAIGANAELALLENGNHVCNNIPYVYRALTADWLKEKVSSSQVSGDYIF